MHFGIRLVWIPSQKSSWNETFCKTFSRWSTDLSDSLSSIFLVLAVINIFFRVTQKRINPFTDLRSNEFSFFCQIDEEYVSGSDDSNEVITCLYENGGFEIVLNRPKQLNTLTVGMLATLQRIITEIASNPRVKFVILRGSGEKAFCAGGDLKDVALAHLGTHPKKVPQFFVPFGLIVIERRFYSTRIQVGLCSCQIESPQAIYRSMGWNRNGRWRRSFSCLALHCCDREIHVCYA